MYRIQQILFGRILFNRLCFAGSQGECAQKHTDLLTNRSQYLGHTAVCCLAKRFFLSREVLKAKKENKSEGPPTPIK